MTTLHFNARAYSELPQDLRLVVQVYGGRNVDGSWKVVMPEGRASGMLERLGLRTYAETAAEVASV